MENINLSLSRFVNNGVTILSGRKKGELVREKLNVPNVDKQIVEDNLIVLVSIPDEVSSLNDSFILGLFGPSIIELGKQKFEEHFIFKMENGEDVDEFLKEDIEFGVNYALKVLG